MDAIPKRRRLPRAVPSAEREERRRLNQQAHMEATRNGTAFKAEQKALRDREANERREAQEREDEAANRAEATARYGFDPDAPY